MPLIDQSRNQARNSPQSTGDQTRQGSPSKAKPPRISDGVFRGESDFRSEPYSPKNPDKYFAPQPKSFLEV